jgi:hypothetical protein
MSTMEHFIRVINDALDQQLCDALIKKFHNSDNRHDGNIGGGVDTSKKRSQDLSLSRDEEFQQELKMIIKTTTQHLIQYFNDYYFALIGPLGIKIQTQGSDDLTNITEENYETLARPILGRLVAQFFRLGEINMQHYQANLGGYPYWHSEAYPDPPHNEALHRILLFMYYLNDVKSGGETDFYYQKQSVKPQQGTMVIAPAYFTHTHRGNVPRSNDKYILTSWVLFKRGDDLYKN